MIKVSKEEQDNNTKDSQLREAQAEFDPKLELLFNRIQFFQQ